MVDGEFDWVVIGAGASGMTAALAGAAEGMRVLLVEATAQVGGTSARSSGTLWIPRDTQAAETYLDALVGAKGDRELRRAFLAAAPAMIAFLEEQGFRFRPYPHHPDYRQELPGAALGERPLEPPAFDARALGSDFARLAPPIPEMTLLNGMMLTRAEAAGLLRAYKSPADAWRGARLLARYLADRLRYPRGTRLVLGNALVARLYQCLRARDVPIRLEARAERLLAEGGRVCGAEIRVDGALQRLGARRGVLLAGGGFPGGAEWREKHLPRPVARHTPACEACTGETLRLGIAAGGRLGPEGEHNALWFPSSVARREDGSTAVYPHILLDRAKPGVVAVGASGKRFVDEAVSYHEFGRAMYRTGNVPAWLVCDRRFLWRYGLGMIQPMTWRLDRHVANGYLHRANTLHELARAIGVDAAGLAETARRHGEFARAGIDADFGKGGNPYDRANGDAGHKPNPCLGPIEAPPFYAVRIEPTPLATSLGLLTDGHARVLDASGAPIDGLYAAGNDMHSIMGGEYPGPGSMLGPGMTFAFLAARHAAAVALKPQAANCAGP